MSETGILVVDDEKNIRLALEEALEPVGYEVLSAANGTEAMELLEGRSPALMLLDLKMPGLNGIEVLEQTARTHPDVRVIIITAHGNIDNAVEAMKLGAIDFIQKPFSVAAIRDLVQRVLDREQIDAERAESYDEHMELAKRYISDRHFEAAREHVKRAIGDDPARPEAFNLLGVLEEIAGRRIEAQQQYRVAVDIDPTCQAAQKNLARSTRAPSQRGGPPTLT